MAQISRLRDTEISNGNLINADDLDTEFNQLVSESNGQDTRLTNIETNPQTLAGLKTFTGGIATDTIAERTANAGVTVDGVLIKDRTIDLGSIGAVISAVDTTTERITTTPAHGLITPNAIRFETTNTLPAPLAINTTYFIGFISTTEFNVYPTEADALASTNVINLTTTGTGTHSIISDPTSPLDGQLWFDAASNRFRGKRRGVAAESFLPASIIPFQNTRPPVWATTSTFTITAIDCTDSLGTSRMTKTGSTTVDVSTTGLNGLNRTSANLTGTIAYNNASAAVTGTGTAFLTTFVPGDTIFDQTNSVIVGVVGSITNDTSLTLAANFSGTNRTGASFRRGARALNSWWYPYVISDGTTPGIILSNRNVAGGASLPSLDLPSGYTLSRQLPFAIRLNGTGLGEIINFVVGPGWPTRPTILYNTTATIANTGPAYVVGALNVLSAGTSTSYAAISLVSLVPAISRMADFQWIHTGGSFSKIRATGGTNERAYGTGAGFLAFGVLPNVITNSSQSVDYLVNTSSVYLDVLGYTVTEVA